MKLKKWEIPLVLILVLALCLWAFWPKAQGSRVQVSVDGQVLLEKSLDQTGTYPVTGYGGFTLTLVLQNGQAYVSESTCPDLICQHHAPIHKAGEQIVCLPGRTIITIAGQEAEVDASTG